MHKSFVVFLDIDGVLNVRKSVDGTPDGKFGVTDWRVKILAKAIEKYGGGDIVLTSDWKTMSEKDNDYVYLVNKLKEQGLELSGATGGIHKDRGEGILKYVADHPEIDEYVILDDNVFDFEDNSKTWERLLKTEGKVDGIEEAKFASKTPAIEAMDFKACIDEVYAEYRRKTGI